MIKNYHIGQNILFTKLIYEYLKLKQNNCTFLYHKKKIINDTFFMKKLNYYKNVLKIKTNDQSLYIQEFVEKNQV